MTNMIRNLEDLLLDNVGLSLALKRDIVKIGWQVHLLYPWAKPLTGLPLPLSG